MKNKLLITSALAAGSLMAGSIANAQTYYEKSNGYGQSTTTVGGDLAIIYSAFRKQIDCRIFSLTLVSALGATLLVCVILSYHNWFPKYFGFFFISLIPVITSLLSVTLFYGSHGLSCSFFSKNLLTMFLLYSIVSLLININTTSRLFSLDRSESQNNLPLLYREYLGSRQIPNGRFFDPSYIRQGYKFTVCYNEEVPSLPAFMELKQLDIDPSRISFKPLDSPQCLPPHDNIGKNKVIILP